MPKIKAVCRHGGEGASISGCLQCVADGSSATHALRMLGVSGEEIIYIVDRHFDADAWSKEVAQARQQIAAARKAAR